MNFVEQMQKYLPMIYERNSFVRLLDMEITSLKEGEAVITMPVNPDKHTNLYNAVHGGAVASLADTVMGVACATTGNRVVTIDLNINYIKNAAAHETITATGKVIHCGRQTMVVEAEVLAGDANRLIAKARGTFMVIGRFDEEAAEA